LCWLSVIPANGVTPFLPAFPPRPLRPVRNLAHLSSTLKSPVWDSHVFCFTRRRYAPNTFVILDVRGIDVKAGKGQVALQGFAVLPVFDTCNNGFVASGEYHLQMYQGTPTPKLLQALLDMGVARGVAAAVAARDMRATENASITVRICDARREEEIMEGDDVATAELSDKRFFAPDKSKPLHTCIPRAMEWEEFRWDMVLELVSHLEDVCAP